MTKTPKTRFLKSQRIFDLVISKNLFELTTVVVSERYVVCKKKCVQIKDVTWMMSVTITNLGYGDFTPSFWLSRIITSLLSLSGIFQTALIVGVLSEALMIPPDEKRILASMEKQRKIPYMFEVMYIFCVV